MVMITTVTILTTTITGLVLSNIGENCSTECVEKGIKTFSGLQKERESEEESDFKVRIS